MTVEQLIQCLKELPPGIQVRLATGPNSDDCYDILSIYTDEMGTAWIDIQSDEDNEDRRKLM